MRKGKIHYAEKKLDKLFQHARCDKTVMVAPIGYEPPDMNTDTRLNPYTGYSRGYRGKRNMVIPYYSEDWSDVTCGRCLRYKELSVLFPD